MWSGLAATKDSGRILSVILTSFQKDDYIVGLCLADIIDSTTAFSNVCYGIFLFNL
jgi:hypothetical protein